MKAETLVLENTCNNEKLHMYIESCSALITLKLVSRSQCCFHNNSQKKLRRHSEINQMIYLPSVNNWKRENKSPASRMQQCNLVVHYFLRIFDTIGRILKPYVLANTKWNFYYSVVYICFLIRYTYIYRINYASFLRELLSVNSKNLLYILAK